MLVRIGNHFIDTQDIYHAEFKTAEDTLYGDIVLQRATSQKELSFTGGDAEYLQNILDAQHVISIQHIRDTLPVIN